MPAVRTCLLLGVLLLLSIPSSVLAETFRAQLRPRPDTGSSGFGSAVLELDDFESQIAYSIEYTGLSSPETEAHIHYADGSIAFVLPEGSPKVGVWSDPGNVDVLLLRSNSLYILVHTLDHPSGELRGDIADDVVTAGEPSWGAVKSSYGPLPD